MLRINVIGEERRVRKRARRGIKFEPGAAVRNLALATVLLGAVALIGWQWWSLSQRREQVNVDVIEAQKQLKDLQPFVDKQKAYTTRKQMLEERIELIEQLKRNQRGPVRLLTAVSRHLPDLVWLEGMDENAARVSLRGKALEFAAVSRFYNNLQQSGEFSSVILGDVTEIAEGVTFRMNCVFLPLAPEPESVGG